MVAATTDFPSQEVPLGTPADIEGILDQTRNRFVPETLYDSWKHWLFYSLFAREVLYGGVAGCGKSEALIARALKYVHKKDYRCLILRKHTRTQKRAGGLYARIKAHLDPWIRAGVVKHNSDAQMFTFVESGATIEFSYLTTGFEEASRGMEYHCIIIDELTDVPLHVYTFWFSRLRRLEHQTDVPVQILTAANPGGIGNKWVVKRWKITRGKEIDHRGDKKHYQWVGKHPDRFFLEAELSDNPCLDRAQYDKTLEEMGEVEVLRIKYGDWSASENTRYDERSFIYRWRPVAAEAENNHFGLPGFELWQKPTTFEQVDATTHRKFGPTILPSQVESVFSTCDVATSMRDGVNTTTFMESSATPVEPSWSVTATWAIMGGWLALLDVRRIQAEFPDVLEMNMAVVRQFPRTCLYVEENGVGRSVWQSLQRHGLPVVPVKVEVGKLERSLAAQSLAKQKRIILPYNAPWLDEFEEEILSWTGHKHQTDDQVDVMSAAATIYQETPLSVRDRILPPAHPRADSVLSTDSSQSAFADPRAAGVLNDELYHQQHRSIGHGRCLMTGRDLTHLSSVVHTI